MHSNYQSHECFACKIGYLRLAVKVHIVQVVFWVYVFPTKHKDLLTMAIPAYLWLKDDGGADIKGSVDVNGR